MARRVAAVAAMGFIVALSFVAGWHTRPVFPEKEKWVARQTESGWEIFLRASGEDAPSWRLVVASTDRKMVEAFPLNGVPYVCAHLNDDGTVCLTSHAEATVRGDAQAEGSSGWPLRQHAHQEVKFHRPGR